MVLVSIPLAVIGFKKANKPLAVLSVVMIFGVYGLAEVAKKQVVKGDTAKIEAAATPEERAAALYTNLCIVCHGADGAAMVAGASNLQTSKLTESEVADILVKGRNRMQSFVKVPEADRKLLVAHVLTLRK
jgi:mono/diheme cytochrome c family protein